METLGLYDRPIKSRSWFLELLWPILSSDVAADTALRNGMYVCFAAALLGTVTSVFQRSPGGGVIVLLFLALMGAGIRAGSRFVAITAFVYFAVNFVLGLLTYGGIAVSILPLIAMGLLLGAVRASFFLAKLRRQNAAAAKPPELPESAFYDSAPPSLRESARRASGFEDRLKRIWSAAWPLPEIVVGFSWLLIVLAILVMTVLRVYVQTSGSMEPTLRIGDSLVMLRPSFMGAIHRGDIVAFKYPADPRQIFLKRVVGVPGDHLQLRNNQLVLNGKPVSEPYIQILPGFEVKDLNGELVVPPNSYFVLGDNRGNSLDSRYYGAIPSSAITGRPVLVYANTNGRTTPAHFIARYQLE